MIGVGLLEYAVLFFVSFLLAYLLTFSPKKQGKFDEAVTGAGAVTGVLAIACPLCNVLLVGLLGAGFMLTIIEPLRPFLGMFSIGVLGILSYTRFQSKNTCRNCVPNETKQSSVGKEGITHET
jgi:hypothetical protein